ncbi:group II intron maturase-specific domain-containing protein [Candidatus Glomeribacter gigasporarum]|uniref:group II intron maturase-specific domain-containing protein n=1 Tax=Candidatus Glomeribacter gigasporarum TaxID=132144 RepID=UPI001EF06A59|nr:group II intron maturase-specific domain-containing protein [Candidatus Glomeribacter gigasporarum]
MYCKQARREEDDRNCQFDFLGYTFRPRRVTDRMGKRFVGFVPAISDKAAKAMRQEMRRDGVLRRYDLSLNELAARTRPKLLGWMQYYGQFYRSALVNTLRTIDEALVRWARRKYKRLRHHKMRAWAWLNGVKSRQPGLFAHGSLKTVVGR